MENDLRKAFNYHDEPFEMGSDTCDDLISHIVGLGREEYLANLSDPDRAIERGGRDDYKERFSYCFPYDELS